MWYGGWESLWHVNEYILNPERGFFCKAALGKQAFTQAYLTIWFYSHSRVFKIGTVLNWRSYYCFSLCFCDWFSHRKLRDMINSMKRIVRRSDLADSLLCGGGLAEKYFLMSVRQSDIKVGKNLWHVNEYIWNPERGFLRGWHLLKRTWQFNSTLGFSILDWHSNYCFYCFFRIDFPVENSEIYDN